MRTVKQIFASHRILQATLYFLQALLAYTLMLIAMTFNLWLILAIVSGEAVGYLLFSSDSAEDGLAYQTCC